MRAVRRLVLRAREQSGSVIVLVALFAPIAILFCAFVIDLGNGWWHQRHLQVQADAAALAAAQDLWPSCDPLTVTNDAKLYGGLVNQTNQQVGGTVTGPVYQAINSQTWPNQSSPIDSSVPAGSPSPCATGMVDVKMTEASLPAFFRVFGGFSYIDAQARVELRTETTSAGDIPIAVNDMNFAYAEAYFINESTGTVLGPGVALSEQPGTSNGLDVWTSAANPFSLTVPTGANSDVGVRIALSGSTRPTGNMTTDCATAGTLCYDASSANSQLLDVHGYNPSGTGSPTAPVNHGVVMTGATSGCDQYYTASTTTCTDNVSATLDLGNNLNGVTVNAVVGGTTYPLSQCTQSTGSQKLTTCASAAGIPIAAGSGRNQVDLKVVYTQGQGHNQTTTTTTFTNAQSTYAGAGASSNSGPIQALSLSTTSPTVCAPLSPPCSDMSSLQQGQTYPVSLMLGIPPRLSTAQPTDPPVTMRFNNVGSQNQSVSCTPSSTPQTLSDPWTAALATGCAGQYEINQTLTCPDNNTPVDCVPPATGDQTNKVAKALNYRVLCLPSGPGTPNCGGNGNPSQCIAPNHWPNFQSSDPRIVTVFITPYDSFGSSGSSTSFPIQNFAAFYITGWQGQGQGNTNPCQGNGDDTAPAGTMVGHFIHYVQFLNNGGGGTQTCAPNSTSLNECVAVMTR